MVIYVFQWDFISTLLTFVMFIVSLEKKGEKIWKESFRELPECIVSTGVWLKDDIPVSSIHNIADMHVILVYACILYGAAVWNSELKTEESLSWMWRGGRSGRAGHSHKSDLHSVRSMQADVWKCLCPTWTFNSVTLDNPQQVNSGFSLSVAGLELQPQGDHVETLITHYSMFSLKNETM